MLLIVFPEFQSPVLGPITKVACAVAGQWALGVDILLDSPLKIPKIKTTYICETYEDAARVMWSLKLPNEKGSFFK